MMFSVALVVAALSSAEVATHRLESPRQAGPTDVRIVVPDAIAAGEKLPVVYLLPVEPGRERRFGDAIETALEFDAANRFRVVLVAPTFAALPWYADHPTDERLAQERYFLQDVIPFVEKNYPVVAERRGRLLCGFSKSGWGAWSLLLRHPDLFERAASWDAPLTMDVPGKYGSGPIFGTPENFAKYQITKLLDSFARPRAGSVSDRSSERLVLLARGNFPDDRPIHEQLDKLRIPHVYREDLITKHVWSQAWLEPALAELTRPAAIAGDAEVRAPALGSEIVLRTTSRLAGAIDSLTWNGREFIDSFDHGRQLQSACSFDCAKAGPFWAECFNPTEAGSRRDGAGPTSTSRLLRLHADGNELHTVVQPAFWLAPGEKSEGRPALNDGLLSQHRIAKRVRIDHGDLKNVVEYDVTFTVPPGERHTFAQFEAVTGYMPAEFNTFYQFVAEPSGDLRPLDDGPGEQAHPVVLATENGSHAMGVFSPDQPSPGFEHAGYGRFRFVAERVTKWNCVFRIRAADGLAAGDYPFRTFVVVGALDDVRRSLTALDREFR